MQFLDAVGGAKNEPLVSPVEAAARVAAMQAIYEAAREHKWVSVAWAFRIAPLPGGRESAGVGTVSGHE